MPRIGSRRWIAWKLVQLAARIYDAESYERITITGPEGVVHTLDVVNDGYGAGISGGNGRDEFGGYRLDLDFDYRPDWLDED